MKKEILIFGLILLLSGCKTLTTQQGTGSNDVLQIELYDAQGKLITGSLFTAGAIVNDVPNVKFISINVKLKNNGNVNFDLVATSIFAPQSILDAFKSNNEECISQISRSDGGIATNGIGCEIKMLSPLESMIFSTGLINADIIGYGTHTIKVYVGAWYKNEEGIQDVINTGSSKIISIQQDPIKAGITVDIGTNTNSPPPPCTPNCPSGMMLSGDKCLGNPISNEPKTIDEWWSLLSSEMQCSKEESNRAVVCPPPTRGVPFIWVGLTECQKMMSNPTPESGTTLTPTTRYMLQGLKLTSEQSTSEQSNMFVFCSADNNFMILLDDNNELITDYLRGMYHCEDGIFNGMRCEAEPINVCITS